MLNSATPTVLLVDDVPETLETLSAVLSADGFQVKTAGSAQEALELISREQPGALVSDLDMPGMNGYELARQVRSLYPDEVLLIALSGTLPSGKNALTNCFGFDHLLGKPVPVSVLEGLLRLENA
ncbi:Response regulator receiver domain-containing protein [Roseateles sp. YR242]|uniref:response regulator n=1 Tax=Roseateles sp. YR242 TaxID=1855305 RepID=UPI0008BB99AB|nr:response regulator [Roseateles sp. YR242]SEL82126.1 Response regulator receiver domain-containing protein [Roseateles sp. YR242]